MSAARGAWIPKDRHFDEGDRVQFAPFAMKEAWQAHCVGTVDYVPDPMVFRGTVDHRIHVWWEHRGIAVGPTWTETSVFHLQKVT